MDKAYEITTVFPITAGDYKKLAVRKYIVVTEGNLFNAMSLVGLGDEEEIVEAHEMVKHKVIVKGVQ